mmetsp:Transcript_50628/g.145991  ORF Transcript_50628/g.145991 Transcript_50628/m.145991 type:complete len:284 (+) Transcript_50628:257-1108(+)
MAEGLHRCFGRPCTPRKSPPQHRLHLRRLLVPRSQGSRLRRCHRATVAAAPPPVPPPAAARRAAPAERDVVSGVVPEPRARRGREPGAATTARAALPVGAARATESLSQASAATSARPPPWRQASPTAGSGRRHARGPPRNCPGQRRRQTLCFRDAAQQSASARPAQSGWWTNGRQPAAAAAIATPAALEGRGWQERRASGCRRPSAPRPEATPAGTGCIDAAPGRGLRRRRCPTDPRMWRRAPATPCEICGRRTPCETSASASPAPAAPCCKRTETLSTAAA